MRITRPQGFGDPFEFGAVRLEWCERAFRVGHLAVRAFGERISRG